MKGRIFRRAGALFAMLTVMQAVGIPVAHAAPTGTASITDAREFVSGAAARDFTVRVDNTGLGVPGVLGGEAINNVAITLPDDQLDLISATAPSGWTVDVRDVSNRAIFKTTGSAISMTGNQSFTVNAKPLDQAADTERNWSVALSSDGGRTSTPAAPGDEGLSTITRVVQVLNVGITGDERVTDNSVTAGQSGVNIAALIQNAGTGTVTVAPEITGLDAGSATGPATLTLGPGEIATADFNTTFGAPGTVTPAVDADGSGADGIAAEGSEILVQSPLAATYTDASIAPLEVVPGEPYAFTLEVDKTGDVGGTLGAATTTLQLDGDAFTAPLDADTEFAAGEDSRGITFASTVIPESIADGLYAPALTLTGTDSNGAGFSISPVIDDQIRLDRGLPVITPTLTPPASQVASEDAATTDGAELALGGTITDSVTGQPCGDCTIAGAVLEQFDAAGAAVGPIPVTVTNTDGTLSGTYSGDYDPAAASVRLVVTAAKTTGKTAANASAPVEVDNVAPHFHEALTGGADGTDMDAVKITLSEAVTGGNQFAVADWTVQDNFVEAVTVAGRVLTLDLGNDLGGDDTPTIDYAPTIVGGHRDRVGLALGNDSLVATDGIRPGAPVIDTIRGFTARGGKFYSNDSTPEVVVGGVSPSQTVSLYEDNGTTPGELDGSDTLVARSTVQGGQSSVALTTSELGSVDRELTLLGRVVDGRNNAGDVTSIPLVLDFTLPELGTVTAGAEGVTVTVSEVLGHGSSGSNDWTLFGNNAAGVRQPFSVDSVALSGATLELAVGDSNWGGHVDRLVFSFTGDAADRYQDLAGNVLDDFTYNAP